MVLADQASNPAFTLQRPQFLNTMPENVQALHPRRVAGFPDELPLLAVKDVFGPTQMTGFKHACDRSEHV
jgi:hypothetical protein